MFTLSDKESPLDVQLWLAAVSFARTMGGVHSGDRRRESVRVCVCDVSRQGGVCAGVCVMSRQMDGRTDGRLPQVLVFLLECDRQRSRETAALFLSRCGYLGYRGD